MADAEGISKRRSGARSHDEGEFLPESVDCAGAPAKIGTQPPAFRPSTLLLYVPDVMARAVLQNRLEGSPVAIAACRDRRRLVRRVSRYSTGQAEAGGFCNML